MRQSKIFTNFELEEIEKRKSGKLSDKTGVYTSRIKPKIKELLEDWFPQRNDLNKLIENKKGDDK